MVVPPTPLGSRNPLCTAIRKAVQRGGALENGLVIAEGAHLCTEAQRSRLPIEAVIGTPEGFARWQPALPETRIFSVDPATFASFSSTEAPQGLLALVRLKNWNPEHLQPPATPALIVILDRLQDPGNAGAIVRAAEAFGATGVIFRPGTASPLHPKTLRAAAGSLFRLPFRVTPDLPDLPLFATHPHEATAIDAVDFRPPCAVIIGSEGAGIAPALLDRAQAVTIPTARVESLNAAVAAGIVLYEIRRQRGPLP